MTRARSAQAPIGIFDSGPGGLAVLREVRRLMPGEDVLYVGDTARQPYGPRPVAEVRRFAQEITAYLVAQGAKLVIIGCNTASVAGRDAAQQCAPGVPVLGMVRPGVEEARAATENGRIGVWGTAITIESRAYDEALLETDPSLRVQGAACPELLRLAEKGEIDDKPHLRALARRHFESLEDLAPDTLILGCTDFTCVRDVIDDVLGDKLAIVDPAAAVAREAKQLLEERGMRNPGRAPGQYHVEISGDDVDSFAAFAARFLDVPRVDVARVLEVTLKRAFEEAEGCKGRDVD